MKTNLERLQKMIDSISVMWQTGGHSECVYKWNTNVRTVDF